MYGKWVYMALAALCGVLLSMELHLLSILICSLGVIRMALRENRKIVVLYMICIVLFFFVSHHAKSLNVSDYESPGKVQALPITFKEYPQMDGNFLKAIVATPQQEKFMLYYKIPTKEDKNELIRHLRAGKTCLLDGELVQPEPNRNENAFNYQLYLKRMNIHWIFEADKISAAYCYSSGTSVNAFLHNLRASGIETIENKFPERPASYAAALIFGERSLIGEETDRSYKQLGIVHLLAISGLHVGIIAGGIFFLCLRMGMTRESVFWLLIFFLPVYAVLCGANPPVIRAVIMAVLLLSSKKWRFPMSTLDIFSLSFILFLIFDPMLIYHIGFQLSYAVSFALTMSNSYFFHQKEHAIWQMINISIVSMLSSFPILVYHFYEFSIISMIANLIYVPFYTLFLLPAVFILFALSFLELPVFNVVAELLDRLLQLSEVIAATAGTLPYAVFLTGKPSTLSLIFMIAGVIAFFVLKERKVHPVMCTLPLAIVLAFHSVYMKYSPQGEVVFIDIGQGDSILIKLPYNQGIYLIDTGGQLHFPVEEWQERKKVFKVGRDILIPLFKSKGITRIDKLILTHSDADHIGAAEELIGEMKIGEIVISPNSWEKPNMAQTISSAFKEGIEVQEVKAGYKWETKSASFHFIYPFDDVYEGNDDSLVLYASLGGLTWMFTGDVEKNGESELISKYQRLHADVLKVGHHGSKGSTGLPFVEMIQPEYAIISAGKSNRYGHPHPEVLDILREQNIRILRTDISGAVHYQFTEQGGTFKTVLPYDSARKRLNQ